VRLACWANLSWRVRGPNRDVRRPSKPDQQVDRERCALDVLKEGGMAWCGLTARVVFGRFINLPVQAKA
jgi:hypothetical protein